MLYHVIWYDLMYYDISHCRNEKSWVTHTICKICLFIPESVVSLCIALAISAMAFPSCCILLTLATIIAVLVLVVIIAKRTTPKRKSECIVVPIATKKVMKSPYRYRTRRWRVTRFATLLPQTSIHPVDVIFCYQLRSGFERWGWICCELLRSSQSVLEVDIAVIPCTTVG